MLHHQSIVQYMKFSPCSFNQAKKPMIITEYVSNGTLESILEVERKQIVPFWDDTYKLITIYGIASAMKYIHSKGLIHRNLNPENILLDDFLFPKVSGFESKDQDDESKDQDNEIKDKDDESKDKDDEIKDQDNEIKDQDDESKDKDDESKDKDDESKDKDDEIKDKDDEIKDQDDESKDKDGQNIEKIDVKNKKANIKKQHKKKSKGKKLFNIKFPPIELNEYTLMSVIPLERAVMVEFLWSKKILLARSLQPKY